MFQERVRGWDSHNYCYQRESKSDFTITVRPNSMMLAENKIPDFMMFTTGIELVPVFKIIIFQICASVM
jgi:hypothetical protein